MEYRAITIGDVAEQFKLVLSSKGQVVIGAILGLAVINVLGNLVDNRGTGVLTLIVQVMLQCMVTAQLLDETAVTLAMRRNGVLFGATVLSSMAIGLGFLLLIVPGIVLMARWYLVAPIIMRQEVKVVAAMRASWRATRPSQGTFLILAVLYVAALAAALGVGIGAAKWSGMEPTSLYISIPANVIANVVVVVGWVVAVAALQVSEASGARLRNVFS